LSDVIFTADRFIAETKRNRLTENYCLKRTVDSGEKKTYDRNQKKLWQ